jgi:mono/diheme cytochrome c family protein
MWRLRFLVSAAVAAFLSNGSWVHANSHGSSSPTPGTRPVATDPLNRQVVEFSVSKFSWDRSVFLERHAEHLPTALQAAANPSETDEVAVAAVVADLFGTVNNTQLKKALEDAKKEKERIEAKLEEERSTADKEYAAFLERLLWAGRLVRLGIPGFEFLEALEPTSPEKFSAFEKAFREAFDRVLDNNRHFHQLVDRIRSASSDEERRRLQLDLTKEYGSVMAFLDGQVATSDENQTGARVAQAVAEAIAQKNAEGHHTLDLVGAGNTPLRLVLGNEPTKFPEVLRDLREQIGKADARGGLASTKLALEPHAGNGVQTFRPTGASTPSPTTPPPTNPAPPTPFKDELKNLIAGTCVSCHGPDTRRPYFTKDGDLLPGKSVKRLLEVIEGCGGVNLDMQTTAQEFRDTLRNNKAEHDALIDWAKANGFGIDLETKDDDRTEDFCRRRWQGDGPRINKK